ncbi:MAG: ATP-binding protein [Syntrophorhabdaceae bacterium]|nr:ATP-binding protein [Syntrophorhabdaceae bacterium]
MIITSQPFVTDWFTALNNSFVKNLNASKKKQFRLSYEYIDNRHISDDDFIEIFHKMLKKKYSNLDIDIIIGIMPTSCQFLLEHGEKIFPGIPVVFALPSRAQVNKILSKQRVGLVESASDIPGTIKRIKTLLPETEHLVVISGSGNDDLLYMEEAKRVIKNINWMGDVSYLTGIPSEELADILSHLPEKTAVLMLLYLKDRNGNPSTTVEVISSVAPYTSAPIFGIYDTILGHGIVGGRLTSAESYGKAIATAVLQTIDDKSLKKIVHVHAEIKDIYDWRQIERWGIPEKNIPPGSLIRYRTLSFWEAHYGKLILASVLFLIQGVLISALFINLNKAKKAGIEIQKGIEEREKAEEALRDSEEKYRSIFENSIMGIFRTTPEGRFLSINPAGAKIYGYQSPEEMIRSITDMAQQIYVNPDDRKRFKEQVESIGYIEGFESEHYRKDGSKIWVSMNARAIRDISNRTIYYETTSQDITKRKKAEEELENYRFHLERLVEERTRELEDAKKRAEESDRLKSAFLATMSHELRTPLNSIIGFTGILLQGLVGPLNDEQKKQLGMVRSSANHLLSLINDVLDISKIEAGELKVAYEEFDLSKSIRKVEQTVRPLAEKKGLDLVVDMATDDIKIKSDVRRVEQILFNLLSNAIKFTEQGSITITCSVEEKNVIISVKDTGIGIPEGDLDKVFKPFYQIESGLTRKYEGTGLGLSICKKLTQLLGGEIRVQSVHRKGSLFIIILPIEQDFINA